MKKKFIIFLTLLLLLAGCGIKEDATNINLNVTGENINSSQVSEGVNLDDLGNILNGQYYFNSGDSIYYSSFDESGNAHIYMISDGVTKIIFDGFGWSFSLKGDYLYFSGNEGVSIDGTYNLFRMKVDGSSYERINSSYCFNMSFYKDWLYYIKSTEGGYSLYRSDLDGQNETKIVEGSSYMGIIYEDMLYYLSDNSIYRANPDGTDSKLLISYVNQFIIGMGKIIYTDTNYNIKTSNVDGSSVRVVRYNNSETISRINSYENTVYYVIGSSSPTSGYSYSYTLYSINLDGTNDKTIYSGVSYGYYINIVDDKVYALDYNLGDSGHFEAITKSMNLDGSNVQTIYR